MKEVTRAPYDSVPTTLSSDLTGNKKGVYILQVNIDSTKSQRRVVVECVFDGTGYNSAETMKFYTSWAYWVGTLQL